jgi:hypothetical protein
MIRAMLNTSCATVAVVLSLLVTNIANAHHFLGRPAYGLNEDSNTPPAIQGETQVGDFNVTYMVFPAFPRPNEPGRVNLYVKSDRSGTPFQGKVTFTIRDNSWLSWVLGDVYETVLGTQPPDDSVFRQGFVSSDEGEYMISATFEADGRSHIVEFPLRIGTPMPMEFLLGLGLLAIVGFVIVQRRRSMTGKLREAHTGDSGT